MIGFISPRRGNRPVGLVAYLFGPGRHNEHTDPHVIAAAASLGIEDGHRFDDRSQVLALGYELDAHRVAMGVEVAGGHVWHCSISNPAEDRKLSDAEWAEVVRAVVDKLGFSEASGKAPCRWVAVHHGLSRAGNDHVHLVVNLVREDGTKASIWNDRRKLGRVCAEFERRFGLRIVEGRFGAGMPGVSRAEQERAQREGRAEPDRVCLARTVRGCAVAAGSEAEFVRRLRRAGVLVRPRYAPGGRDEVVGYSVALRPQTGDEKPVWFGGGRLAPDLALPRLREHWSATPQARDEALAVWRGAGAPGREARVYGEETWEQAAKVVARVRAYLATVPLDDVAAWAGAARETAGVLAAWSARLERGRPGPLAAAADALARSAQTRYGQPRARRSGPVKDLRGVAMVASQATAGRGLAGQVLLLRELTRMMQALHDVHVAQGQARQAAALASVARDRLAQLHRAMPAQVPAGPLGQVLPRGWPQRGGSDIGLD